MQCILYIIQWLSYSIQCIKSCRESGPSPSIVSVLTRIKATQSNIHKRSSIRCAYIFYLYSVFICLSWSTTGQWSAVTAVTAVAGIDGFVDQRWSIRASVWRRRYHVSHDLGEMKNSRVHNKCRRFQMEKKNICIFVIKIQRFIKRSTFYRNNILIFL